MYSRLLALLLAGVFTLALTACGRDGAPISSVPVPETSAPSTTTTVEVITRPNRQGTNNCVVRTPAIIVFSTQRDYEAAMRTYTDDDTLYHLFESTNAHGIFSFNFDGTLFDTLTGDRYFLSPKLPSGCTLTKAEFTDEGISKFTVALSDGGSVTLTYRHDRRMNEEYEYSVHTHLRNAGGATVTRHHTEDNTVVGYYSWWEHNAYCRANFMNTTPDTADAFVKELSFEKVSLNE